MVNIKNPKICLRAKIALITPELEVVAFKRHPDDTRPGFWDLLGGEPKVFPDGTLEGLKDAALREMDEEAGIDYFGDPSLVGRLHPLPLVEVTKIGKGSKPKTKYTQIYVAGTSATREDIILPEFHEVDEGDYPHTDVKFFPVDGFVNLSDTESSPEHREAIWNNPDPVHSAWIDACSMRRERIRQEVKFGPPVGALGLQALAAAA